MSENWESTPNLSLPRVISAQAQAHVTHNDALGRLDAVVQLAVIDRDLAAAPAGPREGDRYIVAPGASGHWSGQAGKVAVFDGGDWIFLAPQAGWRCWLTDDQALVVHDGTEWTPLGGSSGSDAFERIAIGTTPSSGEPFRARLGTAVWTALYDADGGDGSLRMQLNKEGSSDVGSFILQTGWSGRAEIGLVGNDNLSLRVSSDGSAWKDALVIDKGTGAVTMPFTSSSGSTMPAGAVGIFAMSTAPTGWLEMDGSLVSRTSYAALFAAIGTTYGAGDGSTTFKLPDARGLALRGWDHGRGIDAARTFGSFQTHRTEGLAARITPSSSEIYYREVSHSFTANSYTTGTTRNTVSSSRSNGVEVAATGSGETAMANLALLFCIKT